MQFRVIDLRNRSFIILFAILLVLTLPIIFACLFVGRWDVALVMASLLILFIVTFIYTSLIEKIVIRESGIEYFRITKHYKMSWQDIKTVGIGYYLYRTSRSPALIYFSTNEIPFPILAGKISNKCIRAHYRKEIITEVSKYWTKEIYGLHLIERK